MRDRGFSLVEMVIATAIMLVVSASIFTLMNPAHGVFGAQVEALDVQQRLRAAIDMMNQDLLMAGAGADLEAASGPLGRYRASILPSRAGRLASDPPGSYFTDKITLVSVPMLAAQTTVREAMAGPAAEIPVNAQSGCPAYEALCRFEAGMNVVVFDDKGWWDTFRITNVDSGALHLEHGGALRKAYDAGAVVAEITSHTYWLRADPISGSNQLMRYDGQQSDLPIVDNVVALAFEYYGDPAPPQMRPGALSKTSYGPLPPEVGFDETADDWGAGENCAFFAAGGVHVPRLGWAAAIEGLTRLTRAELTDGPWCPDASADERYDADLLRIRRVKVTLRMRAPRARERQLSFDVAVRNLNLER
jgi:prepilin-type N-terminal cleavage/methylation domain-containing protein